MTPRNRFLLSEFELKAAKPAGAICVFVSHNREDSAAAKALANYLLNDVKVDVYIDVFDQALARAAAADDEVRIADLIEAGLDASTHLLGVLSSNTRGSWWVPFEIGSARGRGKPLAHVLLDHLSYLPSYLLKSTLIFDQVLLSKLGA